MSYFVILFALVVCAHTFPIKEKDLTYEEQLGQIINETAECITDKAEPVLAKLKEHDHKAVLEIANEALKHFITNTATLAQSYFVLQEEQENADEQTSGEDDNGFDTFVSDATNDDIDEDVDFDIVDSEEENKEAHNFQDVEEEVAKVSSSNIEKSTAKFISGQDKTGINMFSDFYHRYQDAAYLGEEYNENKFEDVEEEHETSEVEKVPSSNIEKSIQTVEFTDESSFDQRLEKILEKDEISQEELPKDL